MSLGAGGEQVQAMPLDWYNLTGVSLIKVDVQGAEKLVLYGAQASLGPRGGGQNCRDGR